MRGCISTFFIGKNLVDVCSVVKLDIVLRLVNINAVESGDDAERLHLDSHMLINKVNYLVCQVLALATDGEVIYLPNKVYLFTFIVRVIVQA